MLIFQVKPALSLQSTEHTLCMVGEKSKEKFEEENETDIFQLFILY